ncbi:MAG: nucleoside phosphorylase, partial [Chloroflexota bacterium]
CGGAGVIETKSEMGSIYVPTGAVRDEGLSYHYLPADEPALPHPDAVAAIETTLKERNISYKTGLTWTTDAIYRETKAKINRRREQGCLTVEMEASAFFAVAQFREAVFGQLLYGGDDVSSDTWDSRNWQHAESIRETLFWLAADCVAAL